MDTLYGLYGTVQGILVQIPPIIWTGQTPADKSLKAGDFIAYLWTTGWELGKVWPAKKMSRTQKREAKEMEAPVLIWYDDDLGSMTYVTYLNICLGVTIIV